MRTGRLIMTITTSVRGMATSPSTRRRRRVIPTTPVVMRRRIVPTGRWVIMPRIAIRAVSV
jgi:hypothetical protein